MTENAPILVLGGRGKTGRRVVARLQDRGVPVRVGSRTTGTRFDWTAPETWGPALDGVGAVYVVPMNEFVDQSAVEDFVRLAAEAKVRRLVLLSARGGDGRALPEQEPVERAVRDSGAEWTILRPAWFAQNFSEDFFLDPLLAGELALPTGEGREAFVDAEDIADVAVAALTADGHAGEIYELSGPEALSLRSVASLISEATGRDIRYLPVGVADFTAALTSQGWPSDVVETVTALLGKIADGRGEHLSDGVQRALGRAPRPFADYVKSTAATGVWNP
ncbi:NAD(P)H-binding protein [Actinomadura sp. NPDC047616]|uniref:NAD(P)H-binding protein n=1 Tax=Actinomadura sp. NPDC047616 TaxID=3155914 RepID=UPI0033ED0C08